MTRDLFVVNRDLQSDPREKKSRNVIFSFVSIVPGYTRIPGGGDLSNCFLGPFLTNKKNEIRGVFVVNRDFHVTIHDKISLTTTSIFRAFS